MAEIEIGKVMHYFGHVSAAVVDLGDALKVGDKIHIKGHTSDFIQDVSSMQIEHTPVSDAKAGDKVGIKISQKVHEHDVVYKVTE